MSVAPENGGGRPLSREELSTTREEVRRIASDVDELDKHSRTITERLIGVEAKVDAEAELNKQRHLEVVYAVKDLRKQIAAQNAQVYKLLGTVVMGVLAIAGALLGLKATGVELP